MIADDRRARDAFPSGQRAGLPARAAHAGAATGAAAGRGAPRLRPRRAVPQPHGGARARAGRHPVASTTSRACPSRQDRPARHLPLRPVRQPDERGGAPARLQRHHRQAHRGGLHPGRRGRVDQRDGAQPSPPAACTAATSSRTPTATACSPAAWARTTAPRRWAPP